MRVIEAIINFLSTLNLKTYHKLIYFGSLSLIYGAGKYFHSYYLNRLKAVRLHCKPYISSENKKEIDKEIKEAERFKLIQGKFIKNIANPYYLRYDYSGFIMKDEKNKTQDYYNNFSTINFREFRVEKLSWLARIFYNISLLFITRSSVDTNLLSEKFLCTNDQVTVLQNLSKWKKTADYIVQGNCLYLIESLKEKAILVNYVNECSLALLVFAFIRELIKLSSDSILKLKSHATKSMVDKLNAENPNILALLACHSCKKNIKNVINLNCGHFILCYGCFRGKRACPLCKENGYNHIIYA